MRKFRLTIRKYTYHKKHNINTYKLENKNCRSQRQIFTKLKNKNKCKKVLILSTYLAKRKKWTFNKKYSLTEIELVYFNGFDQVHQFLIKAHNENKRYDAVVLAGNHGVYQYPGCLWNHKEAPSKMTDELKLCYKLTNNVHYCCCNRAEFIPNVLNQVKKYLLPGTYDCSGFQTWVTGFEKTSRDYIINGCPITKRLLPTFNFEIFRIVV